LKTAVFKLAQVVNLNAFAEKKQPNPGGLNENIFYISA
jgi:hypothetical protein